MNVLFSVPRIHTNYIGMISSLIDAGHKVSFITLSSSGINEVLGIELNIFRLKTKSLFLIPEKRNKQFRFIDSKLLKNTIQDIKPDVVIVRDLLSVNIQVAHYSKKLGAKVYYYDQTIPHASSDIKLKVWRYFAKKLISNERLTTVNFPHSNSSSLSNVYFIPFSVPIIHEIEVLNKINKIPEKPIKIVVVSKLDVERKNLIFLIKTLHKFIFEKKIELNIFGALRVENSKIFNDINNLIKYYGIEDLVNVKINLPYEEVRRGLINNDIFILPSYNEQAAISHFEAMASGLPVIITNDNGTNYIINEGINGYTFDPKDSDDLILKTDLLINNPKKIREIGKNAFQTIKRNYQPKHFYQRFIKILENNSDVDRLNIF